MDTLLSKFDRYVNSTITGFDRIIFKGMIRPITYSAGIQSFLQHKGVLNKDFKEHMMKQSQIIVTSAESYSQEILGTGITYISSSNTRKEALAHERQKRNGILEGLIGIYACVESCNTFKAIFSQSQSYPTLSPVKSRCKHLYFYFDDSRYGFMSIRLQTWAPYEIQIALNGREWLRRSLNEVGCGYTMNGNKFLHIEDYELAQELLNAQTQVNFDEVLDGFLSLVFPKMEEVLNKGMYYYWTFWQTEVAKDYIFNDSTILGELMEDLQLYAMVTGTGERILKYFGTPVKQDGLPFRDTDPEIKTKTYGWYDGLRVRHWNGKNSVKFYNEHNVLRFEMTMNDPSRFKIYRHTINQSIKDHKKYLPLRKGIIDTHNRFEISKNVIQLFTEHMASVEEKERFGMVIEPVVSSIIKDGKKYRALDLFGKDKELLRVIADPVFDVDPITNKRLQQMIEGTSWAKNMTKKQLSARISRHLILLRKHGIIRKLPKQRKYVLTEKGRILMVSLGIVTAASINDLLKSAA